MNVYTLTNANGLVADISTYGGIITRLLVPDRDGKLEDIVLGFDTPEAYQNKHPYFGALIGRFANRIDAGKFTLDGVEYSVPLNNENRSLHGGYTGFDKVIWDASPIDGPGFTGLKLTYRSVDGEEGYPGNLDVTVIYKLTDHNELTIGYTATTDRTTILNLTNHSYFNLAGQDTGSILNHEVRINAAHFTPVNANLIPTGEIATVANSPFDFRQAKAPAHEIDGDDDQLKFTGGFDHNWVLSDDQGNPKTAGNLTLAAEVYEAGRGRVMQVLTDQPGVQFYCGNFLDGTVVGKGGYAYQKRGGFCLETQHYPDSPNHPNFPTTRLEPSQTFNSTTIHKFSTR